jgi:hypothetical protein
MTIPIPILSILLILVASGLGALARWFAGRIGASEPVCFWVGLFVFGVILMFGKIV